MPIILLAAVFVSGMAFRYGSDLSESVRALLETRGSEGMAQASARYAFAQIVVLAALADDELTDAEWDALRRLYREHPEIDDDPEVIVSGLRFQGVQARDRDALERQVTLIASDLTETQRRGAFVVVSELAAHGSGVVASDASYRRSAHTDPRGLIEVFARGLGVADSDRNAVLAQL